METRKRTPDGNADGNADVSEDSSGDGNGDEDNGNGNGNEDSIGEGGREANPDNLERAISKQGGGAQVTQGSSKNCTSRESVSPLSRLIRDFCKKYR